MPSLAEEDRRITLMEVQVQGSIGLYLALVDLAKPMGIDPGVANFLPVLVDELWFSHAPLCRSQPRIRFPHINSTILCQGMRAGPRSRRACRCAAQSFRRVLTFPPAQQARGPMAARSAWAAT